MSISDNPLAALGPIAWDTVDQHALGHFLADTFTCAQILADSIPTSAASSATGGGGGGRPRSQTDGAVSYGLHSAPVSHHGSGTATPLMEDMSAKAEKLRQDLRQSWKEVKTGGSNPRDIVVYKMNGGREGYAGSSWFARRSMHRVEKAKPSKLKDKKALIDGPNVEIEFDMFRRALLKEFSLPEQADGADGADGADEATGKTGGASSSTVRTMITKRRLEHVVVDGQGHDAKDEDADTKSKEPNPTTRQLDIYLLEAEFPGPTATRDFVTMLLTTQSPCHPSTPSSSHQHGLRQFMLVSKPCEHPETPQRSGYVRAQYESVELIREVRVPVAASAARNTRKTRSSIDLSHGGGGGDATDTDLSDRDTDGHETAIEWLMITRNNPGGSVPRFLVDKSTPSSIISDANKFLDWMVAQQVEAAQKEDAEKGQAQGVGANTPAAKTPLATAIPEEDEEETGQQHAPVNGTSDTDFAADDAHKDNARSSTSPSVTILSLESSGGAASSARLFNMLSGALGGAGTTVASKLPNPFGGAVQALHSSFEGQLHADVEGDGDGDDIDIDTSDDDSGGDTYSDIDDEDAVGEDKTRGRRRRSTQDGKTAGDSISDKTTADSASVSSIPPPPPTTALEMLAHDRTLALRLLNDRSSTGLSTAGSSVAASDVENDTETGGTTATKQKKAEQQAAAKAAKAAKAADAARKKHQKELQKLQDRQRKAEADILKANKGKVKGVEAVKDETEKKKEEEGTSAQSTKSTKSVAESTSGAAPASTHSSSSSLSADPAHTELQKLREKHDRAVARQEAQYQKEMEKIERKRQQQAEKEAARLRKQQERDEKADTARQLTHARAERDVARKEIEVLTEQVRQLEAQNDLLAAEVAQATGQAKLNARVEDAEES